MHVTGWVLVILVIIGCWNVLHAMLVYQRTPEPSMKISTKDLKLTMEKTKVNLSTPYWIGVRFSGRLGNQMFQTASCYGIAAARKTYCCLYDYEGSMLSEYVDMLSPVAKCPATSAVMQSEGKRYQDFVPLFLDQVEYNTVVGDYLQSWLYLPSTLPFMLKHREWAAEWVKTQGINTGIHVRRGDMGENFPASYFSKAISHLNELEPTTSLSFVVVSDDTAWVRAQPVFTGMTVSEGHSPGQDIAILAACHHIIISVGTFGWWAAYLKSSPGRVIHYIARWEYERPESLNLTAHYPPGWIGFMYEPGDPCQRCQ